MNPRPKGYASGRFLRGAGKSDSRKGSQREENVAEPSGDNLARLRGEWFAYLEALNYKPATLEFLRRNLLYFLEWAHERDLDHPEQVTRPVLESYRRHVFRLRKKNGKPLGIKSQKDRLQVIKQFFRWLCRENYLPANPASELDLPRGEHRLPKQAWTLSQVHEILAGPDTADVLGLRDRAMLELLYATGMRRGELARLACGDLNLETEVIFISQGKGNRDRYVPLGQRAAHWLERYLERSRPILEMGEPDEALFLTHLGHGFNPDALGRLVASYIRQAGHEGGCHHFRHTCATHMLENGADIRFIQQLLGHSKLETTSIYTQVSIEKLRQVHASTHPSLAQAGLPLRENRSKLPES